MGTALREWSGAWHFIAQIKWYIITTLLLFLLSTAGSWALFSHNELLTANVVSQIDELFESKNLYEEPEFDSAGPEGLRINGVKLIASNLVAMATGMLLGLIPFLFLPALPLILNAAIIGAVGGGLSLAGVNPTGLFVLGVLPHGIFELSALLFSYGMGFYLSLSLARLIIRSRKSKPLLEVLKEIFRAFVWIVAPFTILAGLIEAYITPLLLAWFMP